MDQLGQDVRPVITPNHHPLYSVVPATVFAGRCAVASGTDNKYVAYRVLRRRRVVRTREESLREILSRISPYDFEHCDFVRAVSPLDIPQPPSITRISDHLGVGKTCARFAFLFLLVQA